MLENVSLLDLWLRKTVLEQVIQEEKDNPMVEEPKRQLAIILAEIEQRRPVTPTEGIRIELKTASMEMKNG
jgi:hypothetical protein